MLLLELQRLFSYLSNWLLERRKLFLMLLNSRNMVITFIFIAPKDKSAMMTNCM